MSLFPASPTNGQTTTVNGTLYTYNSAQTAWIRTNAAFTNALVVTGNISVSGSLTSGNLVDAIGYKGMPQNARTSQYTLALSDMGFHISITTGGIIIPANSSVAFPIGSTVVVYNNSATTQTISITTDTLIQAGTTNTGPVVLDAYGVATLIKVASTVWVVSGNVAPLPVVNYLIVGGGGGSAPFSGGGGGGDVLSGTFNVEVSEYTITVGAGGIANTSGPDTGSVGGQGGTSTAFGISATGGGGGASRGAGYSGVAGGSGANGGGGSPRDGGATAPTGGTGLTGFNGGTGGNTGWGGGGGGGDSAVGQNANGNSGGNGGAGTTSTISGASVTYGGGGGGCSYNGNPSGTGAGGGGDGGNNQSGTGNATAGANNRGGGAGGGSYVSNGGRAGGTGVVIISYPTGSMTATGGTITTSGGNTIHTFTTNGTFQRTA